MLKPSLEELLSGSAPRSIAEHPGVRPAVSKMSDDARSQTKRRRWTRPALWMVPVVGLGGLALTAGTIAIDTTLHPDVTIPVSYTTDSGERFDCSIWVEGGSLLDPESKVYADYLSKQNWDGIGQRIYEKAVALSPTFDTIPRSERDSWAWFTAETQLTIGSVPAPLLEDGDIAASDSNCSGVLH